MIYLDNLHMILPINVDILLVQITEQNLSHITREEGDLSRRELETIILPQS
jgi:hypothetical protein